MMKKTTADEIRRQANLITNYTNLMMGPDGGCNWKRVPRLFVAADRIFPGREKTNTLRTLFTNEALFVQQGCGSPKEFFEPYLRA